MPAAVLIIPGSLETRTGGYEYDRRIADGLRSLGWSIDVRELDASFPRPTPAALTQAADVLAGIPSEGVALVDGLALGAMPDEIEREVRRLRIVALVHLPLADEIGLDRETALRLAGSEQRALSASAFVVVTGSASARAVARYGVGKDRIAIVEPGTEPALLARGSAPDGPLHLLSVATLNPGKGHDILLRALADIRDVDWRLTCAGSATRHPPTTARLEAMVRDLNLAARVSFAGEVDAATLAMLYDAADLFVLATHHETYGMAVAEALARGLPVVSTRAGAIPDLVGDAAGVLCAPGDAEAFANALAMVLRDPDLRERLAAGARFARERLPTWNAAAAKMAAVLERVR
jgi:glycosyltransferase involved in cell wall biosynthesis